MKKIYAQLKNGLPINVDIQNAIDGFEYLGYDVVGFTLEDVMSGKMDYRAKNNLFVGSIEGMSILFKNINRYPTPIDFPDEITPLLNRKVTKMYLSEAITQFKTTRKGLFIKPVKTKLFDGILIKEDKHLNYLRNYSNDTRVIVSDELDIISEHRAYISNNKLVYCCNYSGDFRINPNYSYIDTLISAYSTSAPSAYTIDVAILKNGSMTCIELNDFWAIGSYGLYCIDYAQMLLNRYCEIVFS